LKNTQRQNILVVQDVVDVLVTTEIYCVTNLFREWFWC